MDFIDKFNRRIELTQERWKHIEDIHPELKGVLKEMNETLENSEIIISISLLVYPCQYSSPYSPPYVSFEMHDSRLMQLARSGKSFSRRLNGCFLEMSLLVALQYNCRDVPRFWHQAG